MFSCHCLIYTYVQMNCLPYMEIFVLWNIHYMFQIETYCFLYLLQKLKCTTMHTLVPWVQQTDFLIFLFCLHSKYYQLRLPVFIFSF